MGFSRKKIGRNEKCPCGSGKKYKHCCDPNRNQNLGEKPLTISPEFQRKISQKIFETKIKEIVHKKRFGEARPIVTTEFKGHRLVAVGNKIHWSKNWGSFHDFLGYYIKKCIGEKWGTNEIKKPFEERHPIIQWYRGVCLLQRKIVKVPGILSSGQATGPAKAYLSLAYDLYLLENHQLLQKKLIKRLKQKDKFQGARYEVFVASCFVKAGFDIDFEDENDPTKTHCEFVATFRETGEKFSVEAKSRHRGGILGSGGKQEDLDSIVVGVERLIKKALLKAAAFKRIVFIDVNMPPHKGESIEAPWIKPICEDLDKIEENQDPKNPWPKAFLFFTNHPFHYVDEMAESPQSSELLTAINIEEFKQPVQEIIKSSFPVISVLADSVFNHKEIPGRFDDII